MGVTRVWVKYATPGLEDRVDDDSGMFRSYRVVYGVKVSSSSDSPPTVAASPLIPRYGTYYSRGGYSDKVAYLRRRKISAVGPRLYEVDCSWDTNAPKDPEKKPQDNKTDNPLQRPVEWDGDTIGEEVYELADQEGTYYANSQGCPFENGVPTFRPFSTIRATRNEAYYDWKSVGGYVGCVNQSPFGGCAAETVKLMRVTYKEVFEGDYAYVRVTYEFAYKEDGWKTERHDVGPWRMVKDEKTGKNVKVSADSDGKVKYSIGGLFYFGTNGEPLTPEQLKNWNRKGELVKKLTFKNHKKKDFARLGLVYDARPPRTRSNQPKR